MVLERDNIADFVCEDVTNADAVTFGLPPMYSARNGLRAEREASLVDLRRELA